MRKRIGVRQRFWAKVSTSGGPQSCWIWTAGRTHGGYGMHTLWIDSAKKKMNAHRAAWILTQGEIPEGMLVCHRCDNSLCVNPTHLFLGDTQQNMWDRTIKGHRGHYRRPALPWKPKERGPMFRFWSKVSTSGGPDSCWLWKAYTNEDGYGRLRYRARLCSAHRAAWEIARGPIPEGMQILHRCDTPGCVNPRHLRLGTQAENIADMCAKGRQRTGSYVGRPVNRVMGDAHWTRRQPERTYGTSNPAAKLTEEGVLEIRRRFRGAKRLRGLNQTAAEYGVTPMAVRHIVIGKTWKHLPR